MMAQLVITDVFLRDGLQDEDVFVGLPNKLLVADRLAAAGFTRIEVTSFVNPRRVPQMGDAAELLAALPRSPQITHTVLALNGRGVERAVAAGATDINIAVSASEAHSIENAGRGSAEALAEFAAVTREFPGVRFNAAVSTAFTCPFEGAIAQERLAWVVEEFLAMGVAVVGLADTLGTTPTRRVIEMLRSVQRAHPGAELGLHLHNADGQAIQTALEAADLGVCHFDAALAGFGGCPFAPGAAGNIATEDLVAAFHQAGHDTGIDERLLAEAVLTARDAVAQGYPIEVSR